MQTVNTFKDLAKIMPKAPVFNPITDPQVMLADTTRTDLESLNAIILDNGPTVNTNIKPASSRVILSDVRQWFGVRYTEYRNKNDFTVVGAVFWKGGKSFKFKLVETVRDTMANTFHFGNVKLTYGDGDLIAAPEVVIGGQLPHPKVTEYITANMKTEAEAWDAVVHAIRCGLLDNDQWVIRQPRA